MAWREDIQFAAATKTINFQTMCQFPNCDWWSRLGLLDLLVQAFALGTVMDKPFRLFNVTMETIQEKFHLGCNSKIGYTQKSSYPRVTNYFPEAKSSSAL